MYFEPAGAMVATAQVAFPDTRDTVSLPAHDSDCADPPFTASEKVTLPVADPTQRGRPTTVAVIVAGLPDRTTGFEWILVLEFALATGCVTEAEEAATPVLPEYDTDTL